MKSDIERMLAAPGLETTAFSINSRYYGLEVKQREDADGKRQVYVKRRLIPPPGAFSTIQLHTVVQGDRLDNLSFSYLGDAELFWRICDANVALQPGKLTEIVGRKLRITLPAGLPGEDNV